MVNKVHVLDVSAAETEDDAPVAGHANRQVGSPKGPANHDHPFPLGQGHLIGPG